MAISAMYGYGQRVPRRTLLTLSILLPLAAMAISVGRSEYGRFRNGESFAVRMESLIQSIGADDGGRSTETILDDTAYRLDGNSYGAMIIERQDGGQSPTGFAQLWLTIKYMTPSFINRSKLTEDVSMRNEEEFQDICYELPDDIDYIGGFWSSLIGYSGQWAFQIVALLLGVGTGYLDNWLAETQTVTAYLTGLTLSFFPLYLEGGVSVVFSVGRELLAVVVVAKLLSLRRRAKSYPNA